MNRITFTIELTENFIRFFYVFKKNYYVLPYRFHVGIVSFGDHLKVINQNSPTDCAMKPRTAHILVRTHKNDRIIITSIS